MQEQGDEDAMDRDVIAEIRSSEKVALTLIRNALEEA